MKTYLAIKFHEDFRNKDLIDLISNALQEMQIDTVVMARDFEKWGQIKFEPRELMQKTFEEIGKSDFLIVEFSEKGVGLGIEAGYAYAKNIPIVVVAKKNSEISKTLQGIATAILFYENPGELAEKIKNIDFTTGQPGARII